MSYTKDSNAHTRGVGAIAATDGRLKNKRRQMQARALRDRDRALSTWTMGPSGGHPGLGAISRVGMNLANPVLYGKPGGIDAPGTGITVNPALPPRRGSSGSPLLIPASVAPFLVPASSSVGKQPGRGYGTNTQPGPSTYVPPGYTIVTDPVNGTTTITTSPPKSSSPGDSGGAVTGGGGAGLPSGGGGGVSLTPPTDVPDVPEATGMSTTTKVLIAAGALGALYLLTRKKGGGA
jgi:hypothetical protein